MVTTQRIEAAIELVRARHMGDVALVAIADALNTAVSQAVVAVGRQMTVPAGEYTHPHAHLVALQEVARTQERVAVAYDILAVALQRLGETVERS